MEKTTQILVNEHKNILKVASALIEESQIVREKLNEKFFRGAIEFIRNYADKFHHAKEEEILFREFNKCAEQGGVHCNPIQQMLVEHDEGRAFVKALEKGLNEKNKSKIAGNALGYARLIQEHIFKEDNILYPMAEQALDKKTQEKMLKEFKKVENKADVKKHIEFAKSLK